METRLNVLLENKGYTIHSITPQTSIIECAIQMSRKGIGALVAMDGEKLIGIIAEHDIIKKFVACGCETYLTVAHLMTKNPITVPASITVREAIQIALQKHIRYLPLVEDEKLQGMVSIGDLVQWIMQEKN